MWDALHQPLLVKLSGRPVVRRTGAGFTLVEMLVVLFLIGLAAGLAYARFETDPRQTLERESRRLAGALEHAALLAQWRNAPIGVSVSDSIVRFWRRGSADGEDRWLVLSDDETLMPHPLPDSLAAAAKTYAGRAVAADTIVPLSASGRNEPYSVEMVSDQWSVILSADPLNRVAIAGPQAR